MSYTVKHAQLMQWMDEDSQQFIRHMQRLDRRAVIARDLMQRLSEQVERDWAPYKARRARKRTPRYLEKGGVK